MRFKITFETDSLEEYIELTKIFDNYSQKEEKAKPTREDSLDNPSDIKSLIDKDYKSSQSGGV
jgi:hypothetical protein